MKILLINPPDLGALDPEMDPPLNLMMIAAALQRSGIGVEISEWSRGIGDIPEADAYGITTTTPTYNSGYDVASLIRDKYPHGKIIAGGPHANALQVDYADLTISGHCLSNIDKLIQLVGRQVGETDLKRGYPLPWSLVDISRYINKRHIPECKRTLSFISSIGCQFSCAFCYNPYLGYKLETIPSDIFTLEINRLIEEYGIDGINFLDDNFAHQEHLWKTLENLNIKWRAEITINRTYDITRMATSGCSYVIVGIESGSDRMLQLMKKPQNRRLVIDTVTKLTDAGIEVRGLFLVGFPGETWKSVEKTAALMLNLPFHSISTNLFVPYPGTEVYHNPEKFGVKWLSENFDKYRTHPSKDGELEPVFATEFLTEETLIEMHKYLEFVRKTESL